MKNRRALIAGLILMCGAAMPAPAHSALNCREISETLDVLTGIEITVFLPDEIDGEEDELLRDVAATTRYAANAEGDRRLAKAARIMRRAYNNGNLAKFRRGLDRAVRRLRTIRNREC